MLSNPMVRAITNTFMGDIDKKSMFNSFNCDFKPDNLGIVKHIKRLETADKEKYLVNILSYIEKELNNLENK